MIVRKQTVKSVQCEIKKDRVRVYIYVYVRHGYDGGERWCVWVVVVSRCVASLAEGGI